MSEVGKVAEEWHEAGASVLPAQRGKRPVVAWTEHQTERAEPSRWNWEAADGFGIVTGYGGLEMLEFEGAAVEAGWHERFIARLAAHDKEHGTDLLTRLMTYVEQTPSGGLHFVYRVVGMQEGSVKLARSASGKTMIETRGRHAWTIMAPSGGSIHEEIPGGRWKSISGTPGVVATFTEEEVATLYDIAREFDEKPPVEPIVHRERVKIAEGEETPGQHWARVTPWEEILSPDGWTLTPGRRPVGMYWTRPGKRYGISADITPSDNLFVFTSSLPETGIDLESSYDSGGSYTKFQYLATTKYGGDFAKCARELRRQGFGTQKVEEHFDVTTLMPEHSAEEAIRILEEEPGKPEPLTEQERTMAMSEDGQAHLLLKKFGSVLRYCDDNGKWLVWNGNTWKWQQGKNGGRVREYAKRIARGLSEGSSDEVKWKRYCLSASGTTRVLDQASTDPRVIIGILDLDTFGFELNTPGGIVDLTTGELKPSDPTHLHTRCAATTPDADGSSSLWLDFLRQTFGDDDELIAYVQTIVGVSIVGNPEPHIFPFCVGTGGNGKGVFLESFMRLLGGYATATPHSFLMAGPQRHLTEIADLYGARLVVCSEVNEDDKFDEAKMKRLTGGDRLKANFMRHDMFAFDPTHHLWLVGNHKPRLASSVGSEDNSIWRRMKVIPFNYEVPDDKRIDRLKEILIEQCGPYMLWWAIQGAVRYHEKKELDVAPFVVAEAIQLYKAEQDSVEMFLQDRCHVGGGAVNATVLWHAYKAYCKDSLGIDGLASQKKFGMSLGRKGLIREHSRTGWSYLNMFLLDPDEGEESDGFPSPQRNRGLDGLF